MKYFWVFISLISTFGIARYSMDFSKEQINRLITADLIVEKNVSAAVQSDIDECLRFIKRLCGFLALVYIVFYYIVISFGSDPTEIAPFLGSLFLIFAFVWCSIHRFKNFDNLFSQYLKNFGAPLLLLYVIPVLELLGGKTGMAGLLFEPIARVGNAFGLNDIANNSFLQVTIFIIFCWFAAAISLISSWLIYGAGYLVTKTFTKIALYALKLTFRIWRSDRPLTPLFAILLIVSAYQLI